jgi:hypothetical protein
LSGLLDLTRKNSFGQNVVAIFGEAGGTIAASGKLPSENKWRTPAAWLAVVETDW